MECILIEMSRSVSRVLYQTIIYLWLRIAAKLKPFFRIAPSKLNYAVVCCSGWGLHGKSVAIFPVRSYRTFPQSPYIARHLFSVALSLRSPSPAVSRHPCPVEPGLSSHNISIARDCLTYSFSHQLYIIISILSIKQIQPAYH